MVVDTPWRAGEVLAADCFATVRRRAIFECCKWDPQIEDVAALADFPLLLAPTAWAELRRLAEQLAAEAAAAEEELIARPDLHARLGLPWRVRRALRRARLASAPTPSVRVCRFDFHPTADGWKISEVNSDVPGGFNEASGFAALMAEQCSAGPPCGDPAGELAEAILNRAGQAGRVALVHATAYADDRQVMIYLAGQLEHRGGRAFLVAPDHLRWLDGQARIETPWLQCPVDSVYRFFPGEWLPHLPRRCGWDWFFGGAKTPLCNPATALLTQSKRFPLVWDSLQTPLETWRQLLPETRDPRQADWQEDPCWVLKPALGRVGEWIGLAGVTDLKEWRQIRRSARWFPGHWVAQRRFAALPLDTPRGPRFPCLGVYTVNGHAAGVYGRIAAQPLINYRAQDVAVLVAPALASGIRERGGWIGGKPVGRASPCAPPAGCLVSPRRRAQEGAPYNDSAVHVADSSVSATRLVVQLS